MMIEGWQHRNKTTDYDIATAHNHSKINAVLMVCPETSHSVLYRFACVVSGTIRSRNCSPFWNLITKTKERNQKIFIEITQKEGAGRSHPCTGYEMPV